LRRAAAPATGLRQRGPTTPPLMQMPRGALWAFAGVVQTTRSWQSEFGHHRTTDCQHDKHQPQQTQYQKDGADDAADHSRLGGATAHGIHLASINTRQVTLAHHPGKRPENGADNQTENTQHEDERTAMRRNAWLLIHVFIPSIKYNN